MKAIMVMFDSLNRHMLPPYGCDWVHAPNFSRLAEKTVTFDRAYVGSMPCMPARRELHTGRYNFLHRSWGPLEPFDDSMPQILRDNGVHSHLSSDHYHYWEDGGACYHNRYRTFEFFRGQEGDLWRGVVDQPEVPKHHGQCHSQDLANREYMDCPEKQPQHNTFMNGLEFIRTNHKQDNWFLHIETFDPHEPYFTHQKYKDLYPHDYDGPLFDWPMYGPCTEDAAARKHALLENAALISMCDEYLGRVLDVMDELNLWDDTLLIVNTDHGFLLGEHDHWGKCSMPFYNEIANMPLFIWDPRSGRKGERCDCLIQTIDLAPTVLEFFDIDRPKDMQGHPLRETVASCKPVREAGLFGMNGGHVNVTDGRYVYMRAPEQKENTPLNQYTLMPTHMRNHFAIEEFDGMTLAEPFEFTKGCKTMKISGSWWNGNAFKYGTALYDLKSDPYQKNPIDDPEAEQRMIKLMVELMKQNDSPPEQFERLGLDA